MSLPLHEKNIDQTRQVTRATRCCAAVSITLVFLALATVQAGPINTDVAFTPREGGSILRLQYVYSESGAGGAVRHINASQARATYIYGAKENLALFLSVPYVHRQVDRFNAKLGRFEEERDGIPDFTVMAKYRFWQEDRGPGKTTRWALLGGLNVRSGDSDFSSDSYDPIVGLVYSWRANRANVDLDCVYQFNTGGGKFRHDTLRYDAAYSYRLFPAVFDSESKYEIAGVAELNGRYSTDGSHEIFIAPGLQLTTERWTLETSLQLPVVQEFSQDGPETNYRFVIGIKLRW